MSTKQVIVMRTKYPDKKGGVTGLRTGKLIAQGSHASAAFMARQLKQRGLLASFLGMFGYRLVKITPIEQQWLSDSYAKVVLQVKTEEELLEVHRQAVEAGLNCHLVKDQGRTEFDGVPTITCFAIGPDDAAKIDKITGHLPLY